MKVMFVSQPKDGCNNIIYSASDSDLGASSPEIILESDTLLLPANLITLCKENGCKMLPGQYLIYVSLYVRILIDNQHVAWTREMMNNFVAMMCNEEYDEGVSEFLDSDNYPLMDDLMEVLIIPEE